MYTKRDNARDARIPPRPAVTFGPVGCTALALLLSLPGTVETNALPAANAPGVADTGQTACYGTSGEIAAPAPGTAFAGQDAQDTREIIIFKETS